MARHGKAGGQQHTAQIQRVSRISVRPRSCQLLVFAKMSRGITACEQSHRGNPNSEKKRFRLRTCKPERGNSNRVPPANSPANPEIGRAAHTCAFRQESAASKTCSTVIRSIDGE